MYIYQGSSYGATCNCPDRYPPGLSFDALARAYYANDQRIKWTGVEDTFGVEGVLAPRYVYRLEEWILSTDAVFFLNQPFDRNILTDPQTRSYVNNWQVDIFQIWQLNLRVQRGDFTVTLGKDNTPFGRYYFPLYSNSRLDAPFIRSDVIRWNETGLFFKYAPGVFVFDAAITNGGFDRDANSSKAFVGRVGVDTGAWAAGVSAKLQDGIGSEFQKVANSHVGADALLRFGSLDLSGEVIYDQYGLYKNTDPNTIFYGRSIYYRDLYSGRDNRGIYGLGYYVNVGWTLPRLRLDFNYGEYYPEQLGLDVHDAPIRRGMVKGTLLLLDHLEGYSAFLFENNRPVEAFRAGQSGFAMLLGAQMFY